MPTTTMPTTTITDKRMSGNNTAYRCAKNPDFVNKPIYKFKTGGLVFFTWIRIKKLN